MRCSNWAAARPKTCCSVQRFVRTLPQITSQYKRSAAALESADLRYEDGYALRLKGVTTGTSAPATAARARR
jgi:cell division protein FtsQ